MSNPLGSDHDDLAEQFRSISEEARRLDRSDRLPFIKGALRGIANPELRQALEDLLITFSKAGALRRRHVVALVHGIRTRAVWFEPLSDMLVQIPGVTTISLSYGYFDVLRFLFPLLRRSPIKHLKTQLALVARNNEDAHVSVIAHSFGTYAVSKLLDEEEGIRFYRVVLCGSVVPPRYNWHRTAGQIAKRPVINECGTRDAWPVFATATWGYGSSGTFGFQHSDVLNRFHNLSHSGFFQKEFYERFWVPLWMDPSAVPVPMAERPVSPWWLNVLGIVPMRWIVLVVVASAWFFLR